MSHIPSRRIRESEELFGAPPDQPRFNDLADILRGLRQSSNPMRDLGTALATAEELEGTLYADLLDPAFDIICKDVELELLTDFFHRAAAFGEARYVSRQISELHLAMLLRSPPSEA